ncbi:MAG TPA: VCBS repeat-containing protein, partial [Candidatus Thermoplasmatota archaeon]|nr:VCBS repeat-containing protein [Candidatus Thermoplasmatota archaeon]
MASPVARDVPRVTLSLGIVALLVAAALALPVQGQSSSTSGGGTGSAAGIWGYLHLDSALAKPQRAWEAFDTTDMNLYDIDGNGVPELVSLNDNNNAYVIDPRAGKVLAEIVPTFPGGGHTWGARSINGIAIGDVNKNNRTDLVIATSSSHVGVWEYTPDKSNATRWTFTKLWETFVSSRFNQTTP